MILENGVFLSETQSFILFRKVWSFRLAVIVRFRVLLRRSGFRT